MTIIDPQCAYKDTNDVIIPAFIGMYGVKRADTYTDLQNKFISLIKRLNDDIELKLEML